MEPQFTVSLSHLLPSWPLAFNPLASLALALVFAATLGEIARRKLDLPRICGYSLAGVLLGPVAVGWIAFDELGNLRLFIDLTLALLLFELGVRVDLRWLRKNPSLLAASLAEAGGAFGLALLAMWALGYAWPLAMIVAILCIAGSPAMVMQLTTELRARGQVTERLMVLTALNVALAVLLAHLALGILHRNYGSSWTAAILHPLYLILGSLVVALLLAGAFRLMRRYFDLSHQQASVVLFGLLWLTMSLLQAVMLPVLLAPLLAGVLVKNTDPRPHLWPNHFGSAGALLVILLFITAGGVLTREHLMAGGLAALLIVAARLAGKLGGAALASVRSFSARRQAIALGLTLGPMSGVAFVLADDIGRLYPEVGSDLEPIIMTAIVLLELVGPIVIQRALRWAGETEES